jgi:uncharacterized low-complexity protein
MAKKPTKKSIALAVSAALAASTMAHANSPSNNSSLLNACTLEGGYMQFAMAVEDKCGEGKCGGRLLDQSPVYSGFIRQVTCCDKAMPNTSTVCGAHKKGPPVS